MMRITEFLQTRYSYLHLLCFDVKLVHRHTASTPDGTISRPSSATPAPESRKGVASRQHHPHCRHHEPLELFHRSRQGYT
jgi:hypothetical protein